MADNYKITQYSVNNILNFVENNQIAIPELQRPFVWKPKEVKDLIDSLYNGYPIGYLIVWQNSKVRTKDLLTGGIRKILIDGQQRVTALMASILGKEILDDQYVSKRIKIAYNPFAEGDHDKFAVATPAIEADPVWISDISELFAKNFSVRTFEKEYKEKNPGVDTTGLVEAVERLKEITKHQVGIIELSFQLDIDVVSEIFIRINLQGKPLNQEDFVMSKISVNEKFDGDLIRNCIDYFCHLKRDGAFIDVLNKGEAGFMNSRFGKAISWVNEKDDLYVPAYGDVLKTVIMATYGKAKVGDLVKILSGTKDAELKQSYDRLAEGVLAFVDEKNFKGYTNALIKSGYCCEKLIYSQALLNYCYAIYLMMTAEGIDEEKKAALVGKWMTMSLITGHYSNSPDSVVAKDCAGIAEKGVEAYLAELEGQMDDYFYNNTLADKFNASTVRSAAFIAYQAVLCAKGAKGLYSEESMSDLCAGKAESYQILPRKFLEKCGFKAREIYGQVANIAYLSKDVKNNLKSKTPAEYKEEILEKLGDVKETLAEHGIPENLFEIEKSAIEKFFQKRRENMANTIKEFYEAL